MAKRKLTNYIRAYRRRAGLTQGELAALLGVKVRGPISEIENRRRVPLLRTALALAAVFGIPVEEVFPGMRESIASEVNGRMRRFASAASSKVETKDKRRGYRTKRKLDWLKSRCGAAGIHGSGKEANPRT